MGLGYDGELRVINSPEQVTDDLLKEALEWAEANFGLGNRFVIDWERTWDDLELFAGYDVQSWEAMDKIQRWVRKNREW